MTGQNSTTEKPQWKPSNKQAAVLRAQQEGGFGQSILAICKRARVDRKSWYNWMESDPDFKREWQEAPFRDLQNHLAGPWRALITKASRGDTAAIRLLFEIAGIYVPTAKQELSGGLTLEQIVLSMGKTNGNGNGHAAPEPPPFRKMA